MFARTYTAFLSGIQGRMTAVETYISNGLPGFHIVGLTDLILLLQIDGKAEVITILPLPCPF